MSSKRIYLLIVIITLIIAFVTFNCLVLKIENNNEQVIYKDTDNYKIDISYKITPVSSINNKTKIMINSNRKNFLKNIDNKEKDFLKIKYDAKEYKNICFIHYEILSFKNNNYTRKDISYYYNTKTNKEILSSNFFKKEKLEKLDKIVQKKLEIRNISREFIKSKLDRYNNIYLDKEGLNIRFYKSKSKQNLNNDFIIKIPFYDLKTILNLSYYDNDYVFPKYERNIELFRNKKLLVLTFDDGPNPATTLRLLDGLKSKKVKATFFLVGNRVVSYPDVVKKIHDDGHQIGNHTFNHSQLTAVSDEEIKSEIESTNNEIKNIINEEVKLLRPPYGSVNGNVRNISNMYTILWSVDTLDWKYRDKDTVYNNIINEIEDGSIILLHDLYDSTVDGVLMAIDELKKQGYEFVTIDEMIYLRNINMIKDKNYFSF